jgi:hypothetical protein
MSANRLERLGQVSFILMCLALSVAAGMHVMAARKATAAAARPPVPFETGRQIRLPAAAHDGGRAAAAVLMLSTQCRFCTESMGFYRRIAGLPAMQTGKIRLSVISLQPKGLMEEYLQTHSLPVHAIFTVPEAGVGVPGTPTLILLDRHGTVTRSWFGALPPDVEVDVVGAIEALAK